MIPVLHPYQEAAKQFIIDHPKCGLFLDMGLGKTLITLKALMEIKPAGHILIIAPKNIAKSTWLAEIAKWDIPVRTKSFVANANGKDLTKKERLQLYESIPDEPPAMWFINRELIADLINHMPVINKKKTWFFPTVVIDELQSFKSHSSMRFKALKSISSCITRFIGLTGTPTPNGLMDLWAEIFLMDNGKRLGKNITTYRNTFFNPGVIINGYPVNYFPKPDAEEEIYSRIKDLVISIKNAELQLPPVIYNTVPLYLSNKEWKAYDKFARTQVLSIGCLQDDGTIYITAANAAVLQGKLSQFASGAIYTDDSHNYELMHSHKLECCEYIINNTDGPVLIAYHFKSDKQMLLDYLKAAKINVQAFDGSAQMIQDWNDRKIPVMLIQPASAGHGLNLQYGGHTLIWYTVPWSLEEYLQTNARLARQGQTETVTIHHLIMQNTIDARILSRLSQKDINEKALLDAVKYAVQDALDIPVETQFDTFAS